MDKRAKSKLLVSSLVAMEAEKEIKKGEWLFAVGFEMKLLPSGVYIGKNGKVPLLSIYKDYF